MSLTPSQPAVELASSSLTLFCSPCVHAAESQVWWRVAKKAQSTRPRLKSQCRKKVRAPGCFPAEYHFSLM